MSKRISPPGLRLATSCLVLPPLDVTVDFADTILTGSEFAAAATLLEMGCGTGYLAVAAAMAGKQVWAADLNPHAVALTARNAHANRVAVTAIVSNLFTAIPGTQHFDIIAFAPPSLLSDNPLQQRLKNLANNLLPDFLIRIAGTCYLNLSRRNKNSVRTRLLTEFIAGACARLTARGVVFLTLFTGDLTAGILPQQADGRALHYNRLKVLDPATGLSMVAITPMPRD